MALFGKTKTKTSAKPKFKATQSFLKISEIREDTLIVEDGTLRAILAVSTTNFDLKNQDEQEALVYNYQRFLNSLEFPIQILMQSRKMDIAEYTEGLKVLAQKQTNDLLRTQTLEYIEFIDRLVESANVMNKNFYCIIPYQHMVESGKQGFFSKLFGAAKKEEIAEHAKSFDRVRLVLDERVGSIASGLANIGLRAVRLNTGQITELLYNSYNMANGPALDASSLAQTTILGKAKSESGQE